MRRAHVDAAKALWYEACVSFYDKLLQRAERNKERQLRRSDRLRKRADEMLQALNLKRSRKRRPPEAGIPVPAVPPKSPLPKQGGAEAPLEFD